MLLSIVFPLLTRQPVVMPADQGRALSAEFLRWVNQHDAFLSEILHKSNEIRPFTVSGLKGGVQRNGQILLQADQPVWWRLTTLNVQLSRFILDKVLPNLPQTLTLADQTLELLSPALTADQHPWAQQTTYEELAAGILLQKRQISSQIEVQFASPTTFHSQERHFPFPLPTMVFRQWLLKWNTFAPLKLPDDALIFVEKQLAVSRYRLETEVVKFGERMFIGFVGRCTFHLLGEDAYWRRVTHLLAHYAFYCGTGAKTTFGLGQTRIMRR